jgi:hypothetical protein
MRGQRSTASLSSRATTLETQASCTVSTSSEPEKTSIFDIPINSDLIQRRPASERELLRHFEKYTSKTMAFSPIIWGTMVLRSAFQVRMQTPFNAHMHLEHFWQTQYEYVMDAILLMTSCHINHNLPADHPNRRPFLHYFAQALSGLQTALDPSTEMSSSMLDSLISCSTLINQYCWTFIDGTFIAPSSLEYFRRRNSKTAIHKKRCWSIQ